MKKIKNVLNKQSGFTLLEAIMNIFILSVIMLFLPLIFQSVNAIDKVIEVEDDFEWNLFLIGLRNELKEADHVAVVKPYLFIEKGALKIQYVQYGLVVRRQVDGSGHEVVLQNIKSLYLLKEDNRLHIQTEFLSGVEDEASFLLPLGKEE